MQVAQLPNELMQATVRYLGTCPHDAVSMLLLALRSNIQLVEIPDAKPAAEDAAQESK
jgi:hypothetical protein